jgi:hypothetical protein
MNAFRTVAVALAVLGVVSPAAIAAEPTTEVTTEGEKPTTWVPAVEPKPLSENVKRGLDFLVKSQHENGGWAQGEESENMGHSLDKLKDTPNVADTCAATLALIRAGSTPASGPHARNVLRALDFLCSEVQKSDESSLFITEVRGTRLQQKLGTYIDTFLAAMVLAQVKGKMPDAAGEKLILAALDKVMDKIEKNQRENGTWDDRGWAPVLAQGLATKSLNYVRQVGLDVDEKVRERAETYARKQFDPTTGGFKAEGSAGVALYADGANMNAIRDSANTNAALKPGLEQKAATAPTAAEREAAKKELDRFAQVEKDLEGAQTAIVQKLGDEKFIKGFGSNGGEEFLSYMNIGESLVVKGGDEWKKWDAKIAANLNQIQNSDGSWTGHHCVTGRTFCTAASLLCLTVDRAPVPVAAKMNKR